MFVFYKPETIGVKIEDPSKELSHVFQIGEIANFNFQLSSKTQVLSLNYQIGQFSPHSRFLFELNFINEVMWHANSSKIQECI